MNMISNINDPQIKKILSPPEEDSDGWEEALQRFEAGDVSITRKTVGEAAVKAIQRMLIFLGYSTTAAGAFSIDGDFGRGTNRAIAQYQFDHGLNDQLTRKMLCYPCTWQTASANITSIPETRLNVQTLESMVEVALAAIENRHVMCGEFDSALFFLNAVHSRRYLNCRQIVQRYGGLVSNAVDRIKEERDVTISPQWILAIVKQETSGVVRPRFEQHYLTRLDRKSPDADLVELRFRSMSQGLGQVLGENFRKVGAESAISMYTSPLDEQVLFVARFLSRRDDIKAVVMKLEPSDADFQTLARYYNGPGYAKHHYHESIERWFREFRSLV